MRRRHDQVLEISNVIFVVGLSWLLQFIGGAVAREDGRDVTFNSDNLHRTPLQGNFLNLRKSERDKAQTTHAVRSALPFRNFFALHKSELYS